MSKRKFLAVLIVLLAIAPIFCRLQTASAAAYYKDETAGGSWKWARKAIHWARDHEVAMGMKNGRFEPNLPVTRAQAYTMLVRLYERYETASAADPEEEFFADCQNAWYSESIRKAVSYGLLEYKKGSLFHPNEIVTRREAAAMLFGFSKLRHVADLRYQDWQNDIETLETAFSDVAPGSPNVLEIKVAHELNIVRGSGKSRFQPDKHATRAEFVKMLYRTSCILDREDFQPEDLSEILSQASSVICIASEAGDPESCPGVKLSVSEIENIQRTLSSKEWIDLTNAETLPDNLPDYWICALDDEGVPVLRIGVDDAFMENSVFLFVGQDGAWHHYMVENVRLPMPNKK